MERALQAAGVRGVRARGLTLTCLLLFAVPVAALCVVLPLLASSAASTQLLAIVSVVSATGVLARCFRSQLLQNLVR